MKVATYLRVSTGLQTVEHARLEVAPYVQARGMSYVWRSWIGSGGALKDLVLTLEELQSLGITFVSINEGIDPSRYLNIHRRGLHDAMQKLEAHRPSVAHGGRRRASQRAALKRDARQQIPRFFSS
jgi:DNA invertase Pin-like site-specific DNA recombinase